MKQPEKKRQRTASDQPPTPDTVSLPTRTVKFRSEIWYPDGSIVLEAESTQFRIHSSILATHSQIFRDMLEVGGGEGADDVDGCPLVHLSDTAEDIQYLLKALYDRNFFDPRQLQELSVVGAMLRLGMKYEFDHLYQEAAAMIIDQFPSTIDELDNPSHARIVDYVGMSFEAVALARSSEIFEALPGIYLACAKMIDTVDTIFEGVEHDGRRIILSRADQRIIICGIEKLRGASNDHINTVVKRSSSRCTTPRRCPKAKASSFFYLSHPHDDYLALQRWGDSWGGDICDTCRLCCQITHIEGRLEIWKKLPSFFGLEDWERLTASKS